MLTASGFGFKKKSYFGNVQTSMAFISDANTEARIDESIQIHIHMVMCIVTQERSRREKSAEAISYTAIDISGIGDRNILA